MIEGLMKVCGALFVGGMGLLTILACSLVVVVIIRELIIKIKEK